MNRQPGRGARRGDDPARRVRSAISSSSQTPSEPPFVQVEVDAGAVARGQVEDDVEVAYGIASMPAGSMPPIVSTPLL